LNLYSSEGCTSSYFSSLGVPAVGSLDVSTSIFFEDVSASSFEGIADGSRVVHDETNSVSDLEFANLGSFTLLVFFPEEVLVFKVFTKDLSELMSRVGRVSCGKTGEVRNDEFSKVLKLTESFLKIVGDWEAVKPVLKELSSHGGVSSKSVLSVLDDLSDRSNSVVTSMVELVQLKLLLLDLTSSSQINSTLESLAAVLHDGAEMLCTTTLSDDSNSVGGSLTERSVLGSNETADSLHHELVVSGLKVAWTKVLNDVIENEESKFLSLGLARSESLLE
jgi:hypothetical protein